MEKGEKNDEKQQSVYYCTDCLSLAVIHVAPGVSACNECGSGNISRTSYKKWEHKKYNTNFKKQN